MIIQRTFGDQDLENKYNLSMKMKFNTKRSDRASEIYEQINMYDKKTFRYTRTITALTGKRQQRHILKDLSSFFLRWI